MKNPRKVFTNQFQISFHAFRFIINLGVDSAMNGEDEPAMIAFHFKTKFKYHSDGASSVTMTFKRGPNSWAEVQEIENTWIDEDGKKVWECFERLI